MSISNTFASQIQVIQDDEADFKKELKTSQKLHEEKAKGKKMLSDTAVKMKGGDKKEHHPVNAQMAYLYAVSTMMNDNISVMGSNAQHMEMLSAPMDDATKQLQQLDTESDQLSGMSTEDAMNKTQELNGELSVLNTQISVMGTNANQDSMQIKYLTTNDNAEAGSASKVLDFIHKAERTKHL